MKAGTSTLNPYAASYIPLSKRATVGETLKAEESKNGNEAAWGSQPGIYNVPAVDALQNVNGSKLTGLPIHGYYDSSSHNAYELTEKRIGDEEFEMDIAYLQMTFPGISDECLSGVYLANKCDMEETVDMLNELELDSDSSRKLPDTLDIGDVSEPGSSTEIAPQKLKKVTGEAGPSSSGSSDPPLGSN